MDLGLHHDKTSDFYIYPKYPNQERLIWQNFKENWARILKTQQFTIRV